jgi:hypothetical protein
MSYDLLKSPDGAWEIGELSVLFADLKSKINNLPSIYRRRDGVWHKENIAENQVERLVPHLLKEAWGWM